MNEGEDYAKTMNWIRVKISFSLIRRLWFALEDLDQFVEGLTTLWTLIFRQLGGGIRG